MAAQVAHADYGWRVRFDATVQHMALLKQKQDRLRDAQLHAEEQLLAALDTAYALGHLDLWELAQAYRGYVAAALPGFQNRWNAALPVSAATLHRRSMNVPDGPGGSWQGAFPITTEPAPHNGACVVYVLFDSANQPCYVGSTSNFRPRLTRHARDKRFTRWTAYPCESREAAYQLEDRLLKQHKPYLNKKRGR